MGGHILSNDGSNLSSKRVIVGAEYLVRALWTGTKEGQDIQHLLPGHVLIEAHHQKQVPENLTVYDQQKLLLTKTSSSYETLSRLTQQINSYDKNTKKGNTYV